MEFNKQLFFLVILIFLTTSAGAQVNYFHGRLSAQQIERVKAVKMLLDGVDSKSLQETIHELERSRHPQVMIEMQEAMAKTYKEIVQEIDVEGQKKREWLYSMVCLNMAYLQFGGSQGNYGSTTELNRLIRQKLKQNLPSDILNQSGFLHSI